MQSHDNRSSKYRFLTAITLSLMFFGAFNAQAQTINGKLSYGSPGWQGMADDLGVMVIICAVGVGVMLIVGIIASCWFLHSKGGSNAEQLAKKRSND